MFPIPAGITIFLFSRPLKCSLTTVKGLIAPIALSFSFEKINDTTLDALDSTGSLQHRHNQPHVEYYCETTFYPDYPTPEYTPFSNES